MGKSLEQIMAELPKERRDRILADSEQLHKEYQSIKALRKALSITQKDLANALNISQPTVAKMERQNNLMLSTLVKVVKGMGGNLELIVTFPEKQPIVLTGFGDDELQPENRDQSEIRQ
jgi:transcriptional regulator with XRE-family HTH domain